MVHCWNDSDSDSGELKYSVKSCSNTGVSALQISYGLHRHFNGLLRGHLFSNGSTLYVTLKAGTYRVAYTSKKYDLAGKHTVQYNLQQSSVR